MKRKIALLVTIVLFCQLLSQQVFANSTGVTTSPTTISSGREHTAVVKDDGSLWMYGFTLLGDGQDKVYLSTPTKIMDGVYSVSCFSYLTLIIKNDSSLWGWGGHLGKTATKIMDDVVSVSCGEDHIAAIKSDGTLWMQGSNRFAQIGNGYVGDNSGNFGFGDGNDYTYPIQTTPIKIMDNVIAVACGSGYTMAIKSDNSLWGWGHNQMNQLGNGGGGDAHTISRYIGESGSVQTIPIKLMDNVSWVACGNNSSLAIKTDSSLLYWGGYLNPYPTKKLDDVAKAYSGGDKYAIKVDGTLWVWEDTDESENFKYCMSEIDSIGISPIGNASIIKNDGSVWSWGEYAYLLGIGYDENSTPTSQTTPIQIMTGAALSSSADKPSPTPDEPSSWAKPEIETAIAKGLVPENLQKNFKKPITRDEAVEILTLLLEKSSGKTLYEITTEKGVIIDPKAFTDTTKFVVLANHALGIIAGVGDHRFDPNGTFTRAQIAAIINRLAEVLGIDTSGYTHNFVDTKGHWVDAELGWPVQEKIIAGVGDNRFAPNEPLTVEQTIAIAIRALSALQQN